MKPSAQQAAIYNWIIKGSGSLEAVARAGCGKTTLLMGSVKIIQQKGLGNIAVMAYNAEIAKELKSKIQEMGIDWKAAQAGTCHSFGFSAWKYVAGKDVVVDENKVSKIVAKLAEMAEGTMVYHDCAEAIVKLVSYAKSNAVGYFNPVGSLGAWFTLWEHYGLENEVSEQWKAIDVINASISVYQLSLDSCRQVIDFDDMILAPLVFGARFFPKDWVMVDESQDTNPARRALALKMLKPRTGRMIFVGDDRQAIYGFTGADAEAMENLRIATKAKSLPLSVTYRCAKSIVREAQRIVPDIQFNESNMEGLVAHMMSDKLATMGLNVNDAILCRNTAPLITTAYEFLGKGIPCRVEGREIGNGLIKLAQRWKVKSLDALQDKLEEHKEKQTAKYLSKGQEEKVQSLHDQVECLTVVIGRCRTLGKYTVSDLIAEILSMFGDTEPGKKPEVVVLSTIHKSKGREWKRVFVLGREKYMPSPYARKEWQQVQEQNLEYVAITRAKEELYWVAIGNTPEQATAAPEAPQEAPKVEAEPEPQATEETAPEAPESSDTVYILVQEVGDGVEIEKVSRDRKKLQNMADNYNMRDHVRNKDKDVWFVEVHNII